MEEQVIVGLSTEVLAKLDILAQKIGVTIEQLWPWLVRQQYVEAIYPAVLFIMFSIVAIPAYRFLKKVTWQPEITAEQLIGIVVGTVVGLGFVVSGVDFITEFSDIFNPEYWALKDLMGMIK